MKSKDDLGKIISKWDNHFREHPSDLITSELHHDLINVICAYIYYRDYADTLEEKIKNHVQKD